MILFRVIFQRKGPRRGAGSSAEVASAANGLQQFNLIDSHDTPRLHTNEFVADRNLYRGAVMLAVPASWHAERLWG